MRTGKAFVIYSVVGSLALLVLSGLGSTLNAAPVTKQAELESLSRELEERLESRRPALYYELLESDDPPQQQLNADPNAQLMYINEQGLPVVYIMENINAARTISTDDVWPGGSGGFSLTGSATTLGELGVWDGGGVLTSHQEFTGRVTQMDSPGGTHYHSTHVAGTMIAEGVSGTAKGMSYQGTLAAYEWTSDDSEMASAAASGMHVSNHSYGYGTGWYYNGTWYWYGDIGVSTVEDYGFGFYSPEAEAWDEIAYDAPYYTICKSAGNDRNDYGPGAGGGHYVWDGGWTWSTDTRDADGGSDGYDCVSWNGTAKNILSVGAINDITGGWTDSSDVVMSSFSGWGPTDDGRIKPDLVANGTSLRSCTNTGSSDYATYSGTSMSSPNLSGSLNLLVRHYEATHTGTTPLSATMKAVLMQTADEAGPHPGPDYMNGWGLMNTLHAADLIDLDSSEPDHILEEDLANGETDEYYIDLDGLSPVRISLAWTDPPGTPPSPQLNPTTIMLVNDLDVRLEHVGTSTEYEPYVLNPSSPANAATTGDNIRDNSEQIYLASPPSGTYLVSVSHKGTLASAQDYSIVCSEPLGTGTPDTEDPVVTVTQPNGGETWNIDSFFDITWVATDNVGVTSVDILLSTDGGATFPTTIATGETNDGIFPWLVDEPPTTQARIKVIAYDAATNSGEDESDADFTIADGTNPSVTVTQPNGGETWNIDSFFDITWVATDNVGVTSVDILLSSDGGATFPTTIATGEANDGIFPWMVDEPPTTQARIKVIAYDAATNSGEDESDADFTIADGTDPSVTVTQPNGGESWTIDSFFDITWSATDNVGVTSIDILLSTDGGATYPHTLASGETNDGIFPWMVDEPPTTQARIKVIAYDAATNSGEDESDADFTIADGTDPVVTVTQPNGGETWNIDSFFDITWSATDNVGVTSVDILLSTDGGATFPTTIATGEANDGVFPWLVDEPPTTQARIKVIAYDAATNSGEDESDADFTIADGTDPSVTVTQPNGGETWNVDSFFDITWSATDNVGVTSIDILLSTDGGATFPTTIATGEANDGIFPWMVDEPPTTQARIKVIAYDAATNSGEDESDADFTIADGTDPSVTVTQPNGGESWTIDSFFDITWSATDNVGVTSIDILLSTDGGATYPHTLASGETNDGIFPWMVDEPPTTQARIKVIAYDAATNSGEDESDADFTIADGTDPSVTVTQPNGGETWAIDSFFDITWIATDNIGVTSIDILLSTDGGATFPTTIATGEANDGVFPWLVDGSPSTQARIKVIAYDAATNSGEDESDADFTIADGTDPSVTVTQPNGGESWNIDSFFDITWIATDNVGVTSVDILLSTDGGATFPTTIATGEANDGIFPWLVDGSPTTQARIKVIAYDAATNSGEDESDADFTIADGTDPSVTVTQPNGGESWTIDSFFDITWSATDNVGVTSIDILLSTDGGATYPHTLASGETNDGIFPWMVDEPPTTQARIKVIAYDAATNSGEDESDADFTIADGTDPVVTVTQPNGGETWNIDSFFDITWVATDNVGVTSIDILLSTDGGATFPTTIATGEANDGVFPWLVDEPPTTQARIKVIAYDAATNSGEDESDADFTIADGTDPSVTVTQPNGGESWNIDSFFDITWIATDNVGVTSVDILLSTDGGATFPTTIATGEANDGIFPWLVDEPPTTQARIKVIAYDAATNSGEDESDADFTIADGTDPSVTVTQPNGGESWTIDSFFDITWSATDNVGVTSIDILLSTDGGATYPHTLASGETNDGIFPWMVDEPPTTQARIKVIAYDAATNSGEDESDADFTIADGTDPVVTVTQPNGGETWNIDSFFDITWVATDNVGVTSIDILLSTDGGATFPTTIATGEVNDGIFPWLVDGSPSTQARIKVIAYDAATNSGEDESDAGFTIVDGTDPSVTVTQPNGGETWAIDSFFDITWIATDNIGVTSVDILLSTDGGATFPTTIATGEANDGIFPWMVDQPPTTQARIKVIAYDAATNSGEDESDADFTIADGTDPSVTVTQPNGGESWNIDSFFDITWIATDNVGVTSVDILLSTDGGATFPTTIATGEANDGIFPWLVDGSPTTQARIKVIAYDAATNSGEDESDADFTIADGTDPVVTVTQPNGGETWNIDSFFDITWVATDNVGVTSIDILLSTDGGATFPTTIATGEVNDGIFPWLVDGSPSTQARIKVIAYDAATNSGEDESDAGFTIVDGTDPSVTVTQPNGGETWAIDSFFDITWIATDNIGVTSVDILLSTDGGATYPHTIATGEANDGIFPWMVDQPPTTQARIKVIAYDAATNSGEDESDANFTIADGTDPSVTVTQPNGGESWDIDSTYDISWTATDNVGVTSIDILLSSDGGATYPDTIATGETNDGVYPWLVDAGVTLTARIKVIAYDGAGNDGEDVSDADFEINDPVAGIITDREVPSYLVITGNMPNPFSRRTTVRFGIPRDGWVDMAVYDVSGRLVTRLIDGSHTAGYHTVEWAADGKVGTGIYFLKLRLEREEVTRKIVISR